MKDILDRIADSSPNESSDELICRLRDCAHEIEALRAALASRPNAQADEALKLAVGCLELHGHCDEAKKVVDEWRASRSAVKQSMQADERGSE